MTDLSQLAKSLQEQVDVITTHLAKEKTTLSYIPIESPSQSPMAILPPEVEVARAKAASLSWTLNNLLTPPSVQLMWTVCKVTPRKNN